jgi:hypothetical protein
MFSTPNVISEESVFANLPINDILIMVYCKSVIKLRRNITVRVKILSDFLESTHGFKIYR